jgi:esterase/lipase
MNKTIIYIGGYKSGGHKSSLLKDNLNCEVIDISPDYDTEDPKSIQNRIVEAIESSKQKGNDIQVVGSSTGGMTALLLSQKYNVPMYLINPLIAKEQFFDQNHPVGPMLKPMSELILNADYTDNKIIIYLGLDDELLNPEYTQKFADSKNIYVYTFKGDHAGTESIDMIIKNIKNT